MTSVTSGSASIGSMGPSCQRSATISDTASSRSSLARPASAGTRATTSSATCRAEASSTRCEAPTLPVSLRRAAAVASAMAPSHSWPSCGVRYVTVRPRSSRSAVAAAGLAGLVWGATHDGELTAGLCAVLWAPAETAAALGLGLPRRAIRASMSGEATLHRPLGGLSGRGHRQVTRATRDVEQVE